MKFCSLENISEFRKGAENHKSYYSDLTELQNKTSVEWTEKN